MSKHNLIKFLIAAMLSLSLRSEAQKFSLLYNFGGNSGDPTSPVQVTQGTDGNLYGTSPGGGTKNYGSVYRISTSGKLSVIYNFDGSVGASVTGSLMLGTDGNFYGATSSAGKYGNGIIFKMTPKGKLTVLHNFTGAADGGSPSAAPTEAQPGIFYGTTDAGGADDVGTFYRITSSGKFEVLYSLGYGFPKAPMLYANNHDLYVGTDIGGTNNCGEVFGMTATGKFTLIYSLDCASGGNADGALTQAPNGTFYGTAFGWGAHDWGAIYSLTPSGTYTDIYDFNGTSDGGGPYAGLVQATDGLFYGTASGGSINYGALYKITTAGRFTTLHLFQKIDGEGPYGVIAQHTTGVFYGNTVSGGNGTSCQANGCGTFFSLDVGLKPFASLLPSWGKVGQKIGILGQDFEGTKRVTFNGTLAKFTVVAPTYLTAIVPAGAKTGFVNITTHSGTLKSNKKFILK